MSDFKGIDDKFYTDRLAAIDAEIERCAQRRDAARNGAAALQEILQREPESPHFKEVSVAIGVLTVELKLAVRDWNEALNNRQAELDLQERIAKAKAKEKS